jgi:hypothetical protein
MRRLLFAGLAVLAAVVPLHGKAVRLVPLPERVAVADLIIVGKVTSIEEKAVQAKPYPNALNTVEYKIAVVKIDQALVGAKGLTHVRVAFQPPVVQPLPPNPKPGIGIPDKRFRRFPQPIALTVGLDGLFILNRHPGETFFDAPMGENFIVKANNPAFAKQLETIQRIAKGLADPMTSLKSKSPEDRLATAVTLLHRYRQPVGPKPKEEPIDAEQSKLILLALADADWSKRDVFTQTSPQMGFGMLNLTAQDGWKPAPFKDYQKEFPEAAKKWLKDNAGSYRVKRFVAAGK